MPARQAVSDQQTTIHGLNTECVAFPYYMDTVDAINGAFFGFTPKKNRNLDRNSQEDEPFK